MKAKILRVGKIICGDEEEIIYDGWSWDFTNLPTPFDENGIYQYEEGTIYGWMPEELEKMVEEERKTK
jgi:hypothetical protein